MQLTWVIQNVNTVFRKTIAMQNVLNIIYSKHIIHKCHLLLKY